MRRVEAYKSLLLAIRQHLQEACDLIESDERCDSIPEQVQPEMIRLEARIDEAIIAVERLLSFK